MLKINKKNTVRVHFLLVVFFSLLLLFACKSSGGAMTNIRIISGLNRPMGITIDSQNNVYVSEFGNHRVIKYDKNLKKIGWIGGKLKGGVSSKWENVGSPSTGSELGMFFKPHSVTFDDVGNFYVTDYGNSRVQKYSESAELLGVLGVHGDGNLSDGFKKEKTISTGTSDEIMKGIATSYFDSSFNLYVTDFKGNSVLKFSKEGHFIGWIGAKSDGSLSSGWQTKGAPAKSSELGGFFRPHMTRVDSKGYLYVVDTGNHRIQKFDNEGKFVGWIGAKESDSVTKGWEQQGASISSALHGGFNSPVSIDITSEDELIIFEVENNRVQKFTNDGEFVGWIGGMRNNIVALNWSKEGVSQGGAAPGYFSRGYDAKVKNNILYVVDSGNNRIQIFSLK